jgi:hypothetical protein
VLHEHGSTLDDTDHMHIVAIAELASSPADLSGLANELGTTLYELKLTLSAGLPAVVLATQDASAAERAALAISRSGHRLVRCERRDVVESSAMTTLTDIAFDPDALRAGGVANERLPYDDILALLSATQRRSETSTREEKERKLRPGMAIITGGLVLSKTTRREVVTQTEVRDAVLYIFRRSLARPWILRERGARYAALGDALRPSSLENFATSIRLLRERARGAIFDDRLTSARPIRGVADGVLASDLRAHLLALDIAATHP